MDDYMHISNASTDLGYRSPLRERISDGWKCLSERSKFGIVTLAALGTMAGIWSAYNASAARSFEKTLTPETITVGVYTPGLSLEDSITHEFSSVGRAKGPPDTALVDAYKKHFLQANPGFDEAKFRAHGGQVRYWNLDETDDNDPIYAPQFKGKGVQVFGN